MRQPGRWPRDGERALEPVRAIQRAENRYETRYADHASEYSEPLPSAGQTGGHPNIVRMVHRLLRGRYLLTLSLCAIFAGAGAYAGFKSTKPMFQTTGLIRVQTSMPGVGASLFPTIYNPAAFLATQAALMRNERVVQLAMEMDEWREADFGTDADVQEEMLDAIQISQSPGSVELLNITATHQSRLFTQALVKSLLKAYQQISKDETDVVTDATTGAQRDRRNQLEASIKGLNEQIRLLSEEFGTSDLQTAIDQKSLNINELDAQITMLQLKIVDLPATAPDQQAQPITPTPTDPGKKWSPQEIARVDQLMRAYLEEERTAFANLENLRQGFGPGHRALKPATDALAKIRVKIESYAQSWTASPELQESVRINSATNPEELRATLSKRMQIRDALMEERSRMTRTQLRIQDLRDQGRREETKLGEVQAEIDRLNTAMKIAQGMNQQGGRMQVLSYGSGLPRPTVDKRKQMAAAGFVFGGGFPLLVMMGIGMMDRRFRYSDDAGDAGGIQAPLLGILPTLPPDVKDEERRAMAAHCVHNIRVLLQLSGEVGGAKVFAITSPTAGDGKTSLVLSLGLSFAASGARTVIVDFDTVGTGLSASLDVRSGDGVLEAIRTGDLTGCVHPSGVDDNMFIVPSAPGDDMHVSRLSTGSVRKLVAQLRDQFDAVLIDTGPILGSIEASLAAAQADGVVLVVGRGQHHAFVKKATERIHAVGGYLAGIVFNRASANDFKRSVSAASVRAMPRALPASRSPGPTRSSGLSKAGPIARTVAMDVGTDLEGDGSQRAAS